MKTINILLTLKDFFDQNDYAIDIVQLIMNYYTRLRIIVKCGREHTLFLKNTQVYACGENTFGQLGLGNNKESAIPMKIDLIDIRKIYCGYDSNFAITYTGEVYAWGSDNYDQLGLDFDIRINIRSPTKINLTNIRKISCGEKYTIFINNLGEAFSSGKINPQFNNALIVHKKIEFQNIKNVYHSHKYPIILTYSGEVYLYNYNKDVMQKLNLENIIKISSSSSNYHLITLNKLGELCKWDKNFDYQLDLITDSLQKNMTLFSSQKNAKSMIQQKKLYLEIISDFHLGDHYSVVLTKSGNVYVWGINIYHHLGINKRNICTPKKINLQNVRKISCGAYHTAFITNSGEIYTCGDGENGKLGLGHYNNVKEFELLKI